MRWIAEWNDILEVYVVRDMYRDEYLVNPDGRTCRFSECQAEYEAERQNKLDGC